jgi:hypothetical protein
MKTIFSLLGVTTEDEAVSLLTSFNAFLSDVRVATSCQSLDQALAAVQSNATIAKSLETLTGKSGGEAVAVATAWKTSAEQGASAVAELASLKKTSQDAEASRALDEAITGGRLEPAKREEFETLYTGFGMPALNAALSVLGTKVPATEQAKQAHQSTTVLSDADRAVAKATGKSVQEIQAAKTAWENDSQGGKAYLPARALNTSSKGN